MAGHTQSRSSCNEGPKVLDGGVGGAGRAGTFQVQQVAAKADTTRPASSDFRSCFLQRVVRILEKYQITADRYSTWKSRSTPSPETFHAKASSLHENGPQSVGAEPRHGHPFPLHPLPVPLLPDPARLALLWFVVPDSGLNSRGLVEMAA